MRIGGFGGATGLREWLTDNRVDAVVDATHPFAATITENATTAAAEAGVSLVHLRRQGWSAQPGDRWTRVPDLATAATATADFGPRIFLTIGRQGVHAFATVTSHWFLIRAIDPPEGALPPRHELLLARGPFTVAAESELLADHRIDALVTKDSGAPDVTAKLTAAREANLPVIMINRPPLPENTLITETAAATLDWLRGLRKH
ncbi:cobalt-precorrin-6A reductase [Nocardia callitridis]|uniref:Cobalt-precorrin-6A reductase n=1 Tax=Nocardia callitridis TaxID=648753 RepID=A0ABP9KA23_9NOCA